MKSGGKARAMEPSVSEILDVMPDYNEFHIRQLVIEIRDERAIHSAVFHDHTLGAQTAGLFMVLPGRFGKYDAAAAADHSVPRQMHVA